MTVRVPRQQRGQYRRAALLVAAVAVVSEHGPAAFSARAVAAEAELPLAAVSYYFPRLDDLLGEAIATVLRGWLAQGEAVVAELEKKGLDGANSLRTAPPHAAGTDIAATAITAALLPSGGGSVVRNRYEHLLAAAGNPVAATAMAELRPGRRSLVARILRSTGVRTTLTPDALVALVDGAAVGSVSEGADDPHRRVRDTLREVLSR